MSPIELRDTIQQAQSVKFILLCHPGRNVNELEAHLSIASEALRGWSTDTVAMEVNFQGCRGDFAACQRILDLTAGTPLYVQNAIAITAREYDGSLAHFCADLETKRHTVETAQEIILAHVFSDLPEVVRDVSGVLSLSDVPLQREEVTALLMKVLNLEEKVIVSTLRHLRSSGLLEIFGGSRVKVHDAMRLLTQAHLETLDREVVHRAKATLANLIIESMQREWDISKLSLFLRLLTATGQIKVLVELAANEFFHELGVNPEIMNFLDNAANNEETDPENRFWALDALVFSDMKKGMSKITEDRLETMAFLLNKYGLGVDERMAFLMKQINILARQGKVNEFNAVRSEASRIISDNPFRQMIYRYNIAYALYDLRRYDAVIRETTNLMQEYYDILEISPKDILGKNPNEIWPLLKKDNDVQDNLKHLADCLALYATAMKAVARDSRLARVHSMKFYHMAGAFESAIRLGQDLVDEFISHNDFIGARYVIENSLLPSVMQLKMLSWIIPVRSQYAVVLAYCGDFDLADMEMERLAPYEVGLDNMGQTELSNQRALILELRRKGPPRQWVPPFPLVNGNGARVGRNAPCPCGSGKKFKKCHGA